MLSFFKLNDPLRLVALALLAFLLKLPTLLNTVAYPEIIHWFTIGEAMQSSVMYVGIWDGLAPFSATIYMIFTWIFGRSILWLLLLGTTLTFFQSLIINAFSKRAKLFENNTNLPAFAFVILTSTSPAFFTLSPALMGLTFILLGLGKLLSHVEFRAKKDLHIILIGLYFGSSILFFLPYIFIIPISLGLLALFSNTVIRRYLLLFFSSVTPLSITFLYYWLISDHSAYFINNFILINHSSTFFSSVGWLQGVKIMAFPLFILTFGILSYGKQRRLTNYQNRVMQLFLVLGIMLLSVLLLEKPITYYGLVFILPIASYFTVHFISLFKHRIYTLLLSALLFLAPPTILWGYTISLFSDLANSPMNLAKSEYSPVVKNKNIMVLGAAPYLYNEAKLAGPFYDWELSKQFFTKLDYYDNLVFLQHHLEKSAPEVIIDLENNWPKIADRLPAIARQYYLAKPNVWLLKK